MTSNVYIYGLIDPRTSDLRYIGKTVNIKERLRRHCKEAKRCAISHNYCWIKGILNDGLKPIVRILARVDDNWREMEIEIISRAKKLGYKLTNMAKGGDGGTGYNYSETCKRTSERMKGNGYAVGHKHTEEFKEKMRLKHTGKPKSEDHKRKIGLAHKGLKKPPISEETRKKMSDAQKRRFKDPTEIEKCKKRSAGKSNPMYGKKRNDIKRGNNGRFLKKDMK